VILEAGVLGFLLAASPGPDECPITFTDVAEAAGLRFTHDRGSAGQFRFPEMIGSGVAWLDYDNDGWLDLYVVQSGPFPPTPAPAPAPAGQGSSKARDRLFRNRGDGTFADVTERAGLRDTAYGMGAIAADYDNDGFVDIYVTNWGGNMLLRNAGDGTFTDVAAKAGVAGPRWGTSAAWGDADGDGRLDLFVGQYADDRKDKDLFCGDPATGVRDYCPPIMYDPTVSVLYRNLGDGTFRDVTREAGLSAATGKALGILFTDLDMDGRADIYVANDQVMNLFFHNAGGGRFEDVSVLSGTGFGPEGQPQGGMGVDAGDLDGDGLTDIGVANYESETNEFYRNLGSGVFEDVSVSSNFGPPTRPYVKFGLNLIDVDNDGDLDAFVTNGHIYVHPRRQGARPAQKPQLLWNDGKGRFRENGCGSVFDVERVGRGSAAADYDNDGDVDIAASNSNGPLGLLRNDPSARPGAPRGKWVGIALKGTKSNRQGIGATLTAELPSGRKLVRVVQAGSSYLSTSDPRVIFGLADEGSVQRLTIRWPSGTVQTLENLPAGRYVTIVEK
jgi:enediyne biosynthesis protein E4